jgi:aspartate kinase
MVRVKKYGGSSLVSQEQIRYIASKAEQGDVIVLSARKGRTNQLMELYQSHPDYVHKVATGELESCMRLQFALRYIGKSSCIIPYHQTGLSSSNGEYIDQIQHSVISRLIKKNICIVPGFIVASDTGEAILLSRGGTDETAIALAISLKAQCYIYSDVQRIHDQTKKPLNFMSSHQVLELIDAKQAPMSTNAIKLAIKHHQSFLFTHWRYDEEKTTVF